MTHPLFDRLTAAANPDAVEHHPLCGAHPALDDGPCACAHGKLAGVLAAVNAEHHPVDACSVNPCCDDHRDRAARERSLPETCPECETAPWTACSCWGCSDYPCRTVKGVAKALGWTEEV